MSGVPAQLGARFYRENLSPQGKQAYDAIYRQQLRRDFSGVCTMRPAPAACEPTELFAAYKAVRDDHPECFWLGHQPELCRRGSVFTLRYPVLYTPDRIARIECQLQKYLSQLTDGIGGLPVLERERLIYERLARNLRFRNHQDARDHNIVGPVLLHEGVCEGQNALLLLGLRAAGIAAIKIYGRTPSGGWHCWAVAWIGGCPVHLDVTWDAPAAGVVRYNYFNISDRQISQKHLAFQAAHIPVCREEGFTWYRQRGLCAADRKTLQDMLRRMKKTHAPVLAQLAYTSGTDELTQEVRAAIRAAGLSFGVKFYPCAGPQTVLIVKKGGASTCISR